MSNIKKYITDTAKALEVSKEEIYDIVVALMAAGTSEEDIEGAFRMIMEGPKETPSNEGKTQLSLHKISSRSTIPA